MSRRFRIGSAVFRIAALAAVLILAAALAGCGPGNAERSADGPSPAVQESRGAPDVRAGPEPAADPSAEVPREAAGGEAESEGRAEPSDSSGTAEPAGSPAPSAKPAQGAGAEPAAEAEGEVPQRQEPAASAPVKEGKGAASGGGEANAPQPSDKATVTLSIVGSADYGEILPPTETELLEGDTVADVLLRLAKANRISVDTRGAGPLFYVEGIAGLYEFDEGPASGWIYLVNGVEHPKSAGVYRLEPGDRVEWRYVTEVPPPPEE
ncbi:MAG TPA: DUF4430 domain-containing protein [Paenibacillaceae bacterium]